MVVRAVTAMIIYPKMAGFIRIGKNDRAKVVNANHGERGLITSGWPVPG
ncbi:MAG: hypothetical protein JW863_21170 [Chitinispirillaceae bacterium]|nr:hypothetical protein [Chitinispirillaceae bacterium]